MEEMIKQEAGPVAHKIASKHLEAAKEQATEDLARAFCRMMDRHSHEAGMEEAPFGTKERD